MSISELSKWLGKIGIVQTGRLRAFVRVDDVKTAYGRVRLYVTPLSGHGAAWVDQSSFIEHAPPTTLHGPP